VSGGDPGHGNFAYAQPDLGGCLGAACKVVGITFVNHDSDPADDQGMART
jgi:hypothetical protein